MPWSRETIDIRWIETKIQHSNQTLSCNALTQRALFDMFDKNAHFRQGLGFIRIVDGLGYRHIFDRTEVDWMDAVARPLSRKLNRAHAGQIMMVFRTMPLEGSNRPSTYRHCNRLIVDLILVDSGHKWAKAHYVFFNDWMQTIQIMIRL